MCGQGDYRAITVCVSESMPESLADGLEVMEQLVELQAASSTLKSKEKRKGAKDFAAALKPSSAAERKSAWDAAKASS